ncbi:WD40/YVTN/BNR-like repeat-containing protein [Paenibacillus agricola]|uniref:Exo-alpha-sialidase n=1 Tax=Paenibacillus agricola TaxID=2716264 RepID=A0ABX0J221_9BACL|nr:exo-alpha-sialidase [Paenibacillus agricola]NHN28211.1 exo-alpha-sialidase [Paenibacillus agricola]
MSKQIKLLVGTNKGVFVYTSSTDRVHWKLNGPYLSGWESYSVYGDSTNGDRLFVGTSHAAYGTTIRVSEDFGLTWTQIENGPKYSEASGFHLNRIWQITSGAPSEPNTLYAGVEEAGIFVSRDAGRAWTELNALTKHPTRPGWFPGAGGMCLHTILVHPENPKRIWVAISAVGVFRSDDGGESWNSCNTGLARVPTGQPYPEVGYCIHKMVLDPDNPDILYMQEHKGVFKSENGGDSWYPIEEGLSMQDGESPFGFPICISHTGDVFLIPLESSEQRTMKDGKMLVYRRNRDEAAWLPIGDVVPEEQRHVSVLRDAMDVDTLDPYGLYFGTTSGELYGSLDRGVNWQRLPGQLSRILSVKVWEVDVEDGISS